jgi:hypothetical protein
LYAAAIRSRYLVDPSRVGVVLCEAIDDVGVAL